MAKPQLLDNPNHDLHIWMPRTLKDEVWTAAKIADLSPSQWLRRAIRQQLEREAGR
jgi:hypothetical protein